MFLASLVSLVSATTYSSMCQLNLGWEAYLSSQHCDCNYAIDQDTAILTQDIAELDDIILSNLIASAPNGIGTVIADNYGNIICSGTWGGTTAWDDKSEINALRNCTETLTPKYFTVYTTIEPDALAGSAVIYARAQRVVYAARRSWISKYLCYVYPTITFKEIADVFCAGFADGCVDVRGPYMENAVVAKMTSRCP